MAKLKIQSDTKPFTIIKNAIIDSENILNEHEKLLYIVLLRYGNKAFPSLATLSKKCGFSKRTVQRTIDTLIEKGLLKKKNRISKKSGNTSNVYTLIDNDKIWISSKENLKECINAIILEEAVKVIEASGMKIVGKEKGLVSTEPTKVTAETSTKNYNFCQSNNTLDMAESQVEVKIALEKFPLHQIREFFGYDAMVHDLPHLEADIAAAMEILHDTLNSNKPKIRINGEDRPSLIVTSKLMRLSKGAIIYAIQKYQEQTGRIKNPKAYMLTLLYNAPEQYTLDMTNQVQHDMYNQIDT